MRSSSILDLNLKHVAQVSAVEEDFVVPIDHWLIPAFYTFNDTVYQELVIVGEEGCSLFWLHTKSSTEGVEDELEGALGLTWLFVGVHLHDVDSISYLLYLTDFYTSSLLGGS